MTPAARIQSAIDVLDAIIAAASSRGAPADRILRDWFKAHRFAGSKDKRAIREYVYAAIRACGPLPPTGRSAMIRLGDEDPAILALFDGTPYGAAPVKQGELAAKGGIASPYLTDALRQSGLSDAECAALLGRAPLDIRVNSLKASRDAIDLPCAAEKIDTPHGLRLPSGTQIEDWEAYQNGLIEVQDAGSQWACSVVDAKPGEFIIDLCAGAGGKTLALAAMMENSGKIIASDTDKRRLGNLMPRAHRAGVANVTPMLLNPMQEWESLGAHERQADAVVIDAPCSGTGTWRRNPESRWRLNAPEIGRYTQAQARLLDLGARLVRPGGRLIYITCSLLDAEGAGHISNFLALNPRWAADEIAINAGRAHGHGIRLTPLNDECDGFFIARLVLT